MRLATCRYIYRSNGHRNTKKIDIRYVGPLEFMTATGAENDREGPKPRTNQGTNPIPEIP